MVIRIDPLAFDEVSKIIIYDFGYFGGAMDVAGLTPPTGYSEFGPLALEIPLGTDADQTFFIASIPDMVPEPSGVLTLVILAGALVAIKQPKRSKNRLTQHRSAQLARATYGD